MKGNLGFRGWFYFRMGWSTYFTFILAAINTLTITYFLAIDNYPALKAVFPSFEQYVVIVTCIGIPLLIAVGYGHYKKSLAYKSEADVLVESNPYTRRNLVNTETTLRLNLKLTSILLKISNGEKIDENEMKEIEKFHSEISKLVSKRNFKNDLDIDFIKNQMRDGDF
tara:strand:+ start:15677 stop:16180 length:504 start_codon:yes stop_codon:yes gene_type:complete